MNAFFVRTAAIVATVISASLLPFTKAEAASLIEFSYDFDNGFGSVTGTVEGDISEDGTIDNLNNLNAVYSAQPSIIFDQFSNTVNPILSVGTIEEESPFDKSVPYVLFEMTNDAGDLFLANSVLTGQKAYLIGPSTNTFVQDNSEFGKWVAAPAIDGSRDIPEPGVVLGLVAVAGMLAPTFSKRVTAE